ncbi:MAG: hypothetical protein WC521_05400 [Bdellovibrionales bacterium]
MKIIPAAFGLMFVLAACSSPQTPPPVAVNQVLSPKIAMDVKIISLADRSGMQPSTSPYNGNRFSPTIAEAVKQWASDRLQAKGQLGQAIIIIKKASLTAQPLPVKDGIEGWFTREQATKYVGRAEVSVEAQGRNGYAVAEASATRGVTLPEDPTENEKQAAYIQLLNGLMKDLGDNLESGIHKHMSNFISTAPVYGSTAVPVQPKVDAAPQPVPADEDDGR